MKKRFYLLLIILVSVFTVYNVNAAGEGVVLTGIEEVEKSPNVVVSGEASVAGTTVNSNVNFYDVGDYIKYKLTLKNTDDVNYYIDGITDNNQVSNVNYDYEVNDPLLEAGQENTVYLRVSYANQLSSSNPLDANDVYSTLNHVSMRVDLTDKPSSLINPSTANNIMNMVLFMSLIAGVSYVFYKRKKNGLLVLVLLSAVSIPVIAKATEVATMNFSVDTDLKIKASFLSNDWKTLVTDTYNKIVVSKVQEFPEGAVDVSKLGDGSVKAWVSEGILTIGSKYMIYAPVNSSSLFAVPTVEEISFNGNLDTAYTTSMEGMFRGNANLNSLDLSSFDTSLVTNFKGIAGSCPNLTSLNIKGFNFSKYDVARLMMELTDGVAANLKILNAENTTYATNLEYAFGGLIALEDLKLSGANVKNATTMKDMFNGDIALTTLDLTSFDTSKVTDMSQMFLNCSSLTSLNLDSFITDELLYCDGMFYNCSSLLTLNMRKANFENIQTYGGMFGGMPSKAQGFKMYIGSGETLGFITNDEFSTINGRPADWDDTNIIYGEE